MLPRVSVVDASNATFYSESNTGWIVELRFICICTNSWDCKDWVINSWILEMYTMLWLLIIITIIIIIAAAAAAAVPLIKKKPTPNSW